MKSLHHVITPTTCYDKKLELLHNVTALFTLVQSATTNKEIVAIVLFKLKQRKFHTFEIDNFITNAAAPAVDVNSVDTEYVIQPGPVPFRDNSGGTAYTAI